MTEDEGGIGDFKPFFDLIVGVLFILIILIAAQMFYARDHQASPTEASRARDAAAEALARRAEALRFLDDLSADLARTGFAPEVDRIGFAVTVPTRALLPAEAAAACERREAPAPAVDREAAARFAAAIAPRLACASGAAGASAACRPYQTGSAHMTVDMQTTWDGATPGAASRALAISLAAGLFSARPDLLALAAPATPQRPATPLVEPVFAVSPLPGPAATGEAACGRVRLAFPLIDRP